MITWEGVQLLIHLRFGMSSPIRMIAVVVIAMWWVMVDIPGHIISNLPLSSQRTSSPMNARNRSAM